MLLFFADDSEQNSPTRPGMGKLVAIGGYYIDAQNINDLESTLNRICIDTGFPDDCSKGEFKWSPSRKLWMWESLRNEERTNFYEKILAAAKDLGVEARVVIESCKHGVAAKGSPNHQSSATKLFLERAQRTLTQKNEYGLIIIDRPSGGRVDEDSELTQCIETLQSGTDFVEFDRIALNVLSSPSKFVRTIQLADLITSCTLSYIAGEDKFAPETFKHIKPLLLKEKDVIGGYGVKIHPGFKYGNLYHWLLGDEKIYRYDHSTRSYNSTPLPEEERSYSTSPNEE